MNPTWIQEFREKFPNGLYGALFEGGVATSFWGVTEPVESFITSKLREAEENRTRAVIEEIESFNGESDLHHQTRKAIRLVKSIKGKFRLPAEESK